MLIIYEFLYRRRVEPAQLPEKVDFDYCEIVQHNRNNDSNQRKIQFLIKNWIFLLQKIQNILLSCEKRNYLNKHSDTIYYFSFLYSRLMNILLKLSEQLKFYWCIAKKIKSNTTGWPRANWRLHRDYYLALDSMLCPASYLLSTPT